MLLVCGEALFDLFLQDEDASDTPRFEARAGGSPFNVAIGTARLGDAAGLFTGVSHDFLGEKLARRLAAERVSTDYLVRSGRRTTLSLVGLNASGSAEYAFYGVGSADCSLTRDDLPVLPDSIDMLHFGSYSCVVHPAGAALLELAGRETHRMISLDPNVRLSVEPNVDLWRERIKSFASHADVIKISDEDFDMLYPGTSHEAKAQEWHGLGVSLVVVTSGGDGAVCWTPKTRAEIRAPTIKVVDTVGAGDTFQAALLHRLRVHKATDAATLAGLSAETLVDCLRFSACAASITCTRRGADLPGRKDVETMLSGGAP